MRQGIRKAQVDTANSRQKRRRQALLALNVLAAEVGYAAKPLSFKRAAHSHVEHRVRALERRCLSDDLHHRLLAAARLYTENGGRFSVDVRPKDSDPMSDVSLVAKHKVLRGNFRLHSEAFMLTYHSDSFTEATWVEFLAFVKALVPRLGCRAWAACMEKGTTPTTGDKYHFHAYFYWNDGVGLDLPSTDAFVFASVRPRVDKRAAAASALGAKIAAFHGLWYVAVLKLGTVFAETNFHAWRDYTPLISWVDALWAAKKLSHTQYLAFAREVGVGYAARKRDVLEVMRDELEASITKHVEKESEGLQRFPTRSFPEIDRFVSLFAGPSKFRRPFLVLLAATNFGKSLLAEDVLLRIGKLLGLSGFVEVTVEADEHLDMSEYDHRKDAGVLLDGVGDALLLKRNREMLQGRPKKCKGGKSATMKFSYPFTLARRAVVVTMDLSAANLDLFATDHWLSNPQNVVLVKMTAPVWAPGANAAPATSLSRRDALATFSVAEVADLLKTRDLAGPASALQANGVNGTDLLRMTTTQLEQELRLSVFASRKVICARDSFLHETT